MSVRGFRDEMEQVLRADGVIAARQHPQWRGALEWRVRAGEFEAVLPGIYAPRGAAEDPRLRMVALQHADPDAVLIGKAAASLTFWPELRVPVVTAAVRHARVARAGFAFTRTRIPTDLVTRRHGLRVTVPALTALDLIETVGGDGIDQALRTRSTTLARMHQALARTPGRPGNRERRRLLLDSRDEPWAASERQVHRMLRAAGITGWQANRAIRLPDDTTVYGDVVFRRHRLVLEIDGREFHSSAEAFESDRVRQNQLVLAGWTVLRITWRMIQERPDWVVELVRQAVAGRAVA